MNIIKYIKKYGKYSFEEMAFNEIDNVIFSMLSYVNYEDIVSENHHNKISINDAGKKYFDLYSKKDYKKNISEIRSGIRIFYYLKNTKRYGNILMYNYKYIGKDCVQFSAITFELNNDLVYISFEGTDHLISGWEEDCKMAYMFPVEAQRYAINYINHNQFFDKSKIILGGHSKGGNLAIIAGMYCNTFVKSRIINIYSNDGFGLREEQYISKKYNNIKDKIIKIIPNYSVIGLLLKHNDKYIVVKSKKRGFFAHNPLTWLIEKDKFKNSKLSKFSIVLDEGINKWFDSYTNLERKQLIKAVFDLCRNNNISSLIEIKENSRIILLVLKDTKNVDDNVKKMIRELITILIKCNREHKTFILKK